LGAEAGARLWVVMVPPRTFAMEPLGSDFSGYEGQYVALDWRTGEVVLADADPHVVLREAKDRNHVVVQGRVPYPDEPTRIY
jgi:hypothetical protein